MAGFSPAPWTSQRNEDGTASIVDASGSTIAVVGNGNSHLIAEAPAMAAALQDIAERAAAAAARAHSNG